MLNKIIKFISGVIVFLVAFFVKMKGLRASPAPFKTKLDKNTEVEIGGDESDFKPSIKLKKWGDECFLKVSLPTDKNIKATQKDEKIKWKDGKREAHFYKKTLVSKTKKEDLDSIYEVKGECSQCGKCCKDCPDYKGDGVCDIYENRPENCKKYPTVLDLYHNKIPECSYYLEKREIPIETEITGEEQDVFEFGVLLKEKPTSNKVVFGLDMKGLRFCYQSELTQKEKDNGAFRPENVIGSYAFYHKTKRYGDKYKSGKAFHIYRPIIEDAVGKKAWCLLDIKKGDNPKNMTVTIPQKFLDEAVYPIFLDPDFGYKSIGGSSFALTYNSGDDRVGCCWEMPAGGGTANFLKVYLAVTSGASLKCKCMVNQEDSVASGSHGEIIAPVADESLSSVDSWVQFDFNDEELTGGVNYILNCFGEGSTYKGGQSIYMKFDTTDVTAESWYTKGTVGTYASPADPWVDAGEDPVYDFSIYLDYTGAASTARRRVMISGFSKIKNILIIGALAIAFLVGLIASNSCNYYVWHKGEKECISREIKEYIENVEEGNINRLKSERGIFSQ